MWSAGKLGVSGPQHRFQKRPRGVKTGGGGAGAGEKPTQENGTGSPPPGLSSEFHWWEPLGLIYQWVPDPLKESRGNGDHRTPTEGETGDLCLSK